MAPNATRYIHGEALKTIKRVWVGFSDGKPHVLKDADGDLHLVAVYPTKWEASIAYTDVRKAELIIDEASRPSKRS